MLIGQYTTFQQFKNVPSVTFGLQMRTLATLIMACPDTHPNRKWHLAEDFYDEKKIDWYIGAPKGHVNRVDWPYKWEENTEK